MRHQTSKKRKVAITILAVLNLAAVALMLLCAYSGMFPPQNHPRLSILPLLFPLFLLANIVFLIVWLFVKRKMALMPTVAMLLCVTDIRAYFPLNIPENVPDEAIKLISMNIGGAKANQKDSLIDYLTNENADIICLQEAYWRQTWVTEGKMAETYPYSKVITSKTRRGKMAIASKYPILSTELVNYESSANMSAAFLLKVDKDTMLVVNNHLESNKISSNIPEAFHKITGKEADMREREEATMGLLSKVMAGSRHRGPQAEAVCDYIASHPFRHTIVCGDFNETANGYAHYMLTKQLNDAYTRTGNGPGFSFIKDFIRCRIDHILYSGHMKPYDCHIDKTCALSDHFPIICRLKLE